MCFFVCILIYIYSSTTAPRAYGVPEVFFFLRPPGPQEGPLGPQVLEAHRP